MKIIPRWLYAILVASLPIVIICGIIQFDLNANLGDYRPNTYKAYYNDETGYWLWVRSFSHFGFLTGYFVPSEKPAPAFFNRFGEGSPLFVYLYGSIGKMVGWVPQLPILINFFFLFVALIIFMLVLKLDSLQILFVGLVVTLFWPILMYLPTSFQETLNQSIGILFALANFLLLNKKVEKTFLKALIVLFVFAAALFRLSWAILFLPIIFLCLDGKLLVRSVGTLLLGCAFLLSSIFITKFLVPPENNSIFDALQQQNSSMIVPLVQRAIAQWKYLWVHKSTSNFIVVIEMVVIIAWGALHSLRLFRNKWLFNTHLHDGSLFDIYNLSTLLAAGFTLYLARGFGRTFIPALLVSVFLLIARRDYLLISILLVINILSSNIFLSELYPAIEYNFTAEFRKLTKSEPLIQDFIMYDDQTDNPWCNTLFIPVEIYDERLTIIPPGIGISYFIQINKVDFPLKSKYVLLDQKALDKETYNYFQREADIQELASLPIGKLFYNTHSGCDIK